MDEAAFQLRTPTYLRLVLVAAGVGVAIALASLGFLGAYGLLKDALWESLPDALGVEPHPWYALAVTTLGGLVVGVLLLVVPGHGGPGPAEGHGVEVEASTPRATAGFLVVSLVSLVVGASLGPEAALLAVAVAVGGVLAERARRAELGRGLRHVGHGVGPRGPVRLAPRPGGARARGHARDRAQPLRLPDSRARRLGGRACSPSTRSSTARCWSCTSPTTPSSRPSTSLEALAVAGAGAAAGMLAIAVFRAVRRAFRPLGERTVAKATLGGLGIGIVALVAGEETLFSGEHELEVLLGDPECLRARRAAAHPRRQDRRVRALARVRLPRRPDLPRALHRCDGRVHRGRASSSGSRSRWRSAAAWRARRWHSCACPSSSRSSSRSSRAPATIPLIVLAVVVGYILTFDRRELSGDPDGGAEGRDARGPRRAGLRPGSARVGVAPLAKTRVRPWTRPARTPESAPRACQSLHRRPSAKLRQVND